METTRTIIETFKAQIGENGYLDIGKGTEAILKTNREVLNKAISDLVKEGYVRIPVFVNRIDNPKKKTYIDVLAHKGATAEEVFKNKFDIKAVSI